MDVRQLRYFIAIAEEGSFSAAAQRVSVAQPTLSQHVISLERELGVKLLERSPRGVSLTQPGAVLLSHAAIVSEALDAAIEAVRRSAAEPMGEVSFGLPSSIAMVLLVPLAETVRLELPKVRLRAIDAMSGFVQTWLEDQSIDLALLHDLSAVRHLSYTQLLTEELYFISAPDAWPFQSSPGSATPLADLPSAELVLPSKRHGLRKLIDKHARSQGVDLNIAIEMDALGQIKTMVARGSAHTVLTPSAAHDFIDRGDLIMAPIIEPRITRPIYLVRNPAKPITSASRELERITIEVIKDLTNRGIWRAKLDI